MSFETTTSMEATRRTALRLLAGLGLYGISMPAFADNVPGWPVDAFKAKTADEALVALYGKKFEMSDKVSIDGPDIAENGGVVPISVDTKLPNVTSISILVAENPNALSSSYKLSDATNPTVSCRLKMAKTTKVIAVVESDGKLYAASRDVKVTLGGCGG